MRLKSFFESLSRNQSGLLVIGGLAVVLSRVERLLSPRKQKRTGPASGPLNAAAAAQTAIPQKRINFFTIKQTRSEIGYVYWVLQGHGAFASFTLFDTWQEAMDEAEARITNACRQAEVRELVSAL